MIVYQGSVIIFLNLRGRKLKYILLVVILLPLNVYAGKVTLNDVYHKFNMRTIDSSYGQRLQYYCGTYPKDYFSKKQAAFKNNNTLELVSGDDVWVFTIKESNKIMLLNKITTGTYNDVREYTISFDKINNDWRAGKVRIKKPVNCEKYNVN